MFINIMYLHLISSHADERTPPYTVHSNLHAKRDGSACGQSGALPDHGAGQLIAAHAAGPRQPEPAARWKTGPACPSSPGRPSSQCGRPPGVLQEMQYARADRHEYPGAGEGTRGTVRIGRLEASARAGHRACGFHRGCGLARDQRHPSWAPGKETLRIRTKKMRRTGMDETCIGRRGKCIATAADPESGDPVSAGGGKAGTAQNPFRGMPGRRGRTPFGGAGTFPSGTSPAFRATGTGGPVSTGSSR
jgi:hypothetical protein